MLSGLVAIGPCETEAYLANRASELSDWKDADYIDTLATAYAEMGNFDEAAVWEQRAVDLAGQSLAEPKTQFQQRLELYRNRQPYREAHPSS